MAGNSAIWRSTIFGAESSNGTDVIEFNAGTKPDTKSYITNTQFQLTNSISTNERPKIAVDLTQDLGFSQLDIVVSGSFSSPSVQLGSHVLKTWIIEQKTNTPFPYGRFGLRLEDYPTFNLTPTSDRGYILYDAALTRNAEYQKIDFVLKLRFNGSVGTPSGGQYNW